jgi:hypothetical protein
MMEVRFIPDEKAGGLLIYLFSIHHVPDLCPWFLQAQLK